MPRNHPYTAGKETISPYPLEAIALDKENPRLILPARASDLEIVRMMYEGEALDELALSFVENGYFTEEPVVLVPDGKRADRYIVVEGNRRVAALKLLLDNKLRKAVGVTGWPDVSSARRTQLASVPAVLYSNRDEVVPYLGFRHISGIKTWEPFQKARYIAGLVDAGRAIPDIERSVGDRTNAVRKMYQSFVVYQQITKDLGIPSRAIEGSYSLLEVTLSQSAIKQFLEIPARLPVTRSEAIVPEARYSELREVVSWVFGDPTERQDRIITDSRQISQRLGPIIKDPDALAYLRKSRDLEGAYEFSGGERNVLLKQIASVRRAAQRALGLLPPYRSDTEVRSALEGLKPLVDELLEGVAA
jgi:hypothetical protein